MTRPIHTSTKFVLWGLLIVLAGIFGAFLSWHYSSPVDMNREARSFAILAAGVLVGGTLLICATTRFWFKRHKRRRHSSFRTGAGP